MPIKHLVVYTDIGTDPDDAMAIIALLQQTEKVKIACVVLTGENLHKKAELVSFLGNYFNQPLKIFYGTEKDPEHSMGHYHNQCMAYQTLIDTQPATDYDNSLSNRYAGLIEFIATFPYKLRHLSIAPMTDLAIVLHDPACIANSIDIIAQGGFRFDAVTQEPISIGNNWFADLPSFDAVKHLAEQARLPLVVVNSQLKEDYQFFFSAAELAVLEKFPKTILGDALIQDFKNWQAYTASTGGSPRPIILSDPLASYFSVLSMETITHSGDTDYLKISSLKSKSAWHSMSYRTQNMFELMEVDCNNSSVTNLILIRRLHNAEQIKLQLLTILFNALLSQIDRATLHTIISEELQFQLSLTFFNAITSILSDNITKEILTTPCEESTMQAKVEQAMPAGMRVVPDQLGNQTPVYGPAAVALPQNSFWNQDKALCWAHMFAAPQAPASAIARQSQFQPGAMISTD